MHFPDLFQVGKQLKFAVMVSRFIWFILFICTSTLLFPQSDTSERKSVLQYSLSYHKASILIHNEELQVVDDARPNGIQFDLGWVYRRKADWDKCHCFPKIGLTTVFWDYDKPDILGYGFSGLFFIEPEYNSLGRLVFSAKAAFGLSYLSNPYDETDNVNNQAYSMHFAFALYLAGRMGLNLDDRNRIDLGLYFNHNSNGGISRPNRGLNYPSLSIGYSRFLSPPDFQPYGRSKWNKSQKESRLDFSAFMAWKQPEKDVHIFSPGIEIKASRQFGKINAYTYGFEYLYDNFLQYELDQSGETGDVQKFSAVFGNEFLLGKLIFSQQLGVYLYKPNKEGADIYQRFGLSYSFTRYLSLGLSLKSHGHVADLVDYRIIYSMRKMKVKGKL